MRCFCNNEMKKIIIDNHEYYLCDSCGYLKKASALDCTREKERYDKHVCDEGYLRYMEGVYKKILPYLNEGLSLDFGCGKIHALANLMNSDNRKCEYYDLYYYNDKPQASYDNIILIEVFEHISDIYSLILDLKSRLNKNGKIIIMTKPKPTKLNGWWYMRDITHISFVEYKTMLRLSELLNLSLIYDENNDLFIFIKNY